MKERYFLIGFMGSGKSTLGPKLARQLDLHFMDLDHELERKTGATISEIFDERGEEGFRQLEASILLEQIEGHDSFVMATGGGTPCFLGNMDLMNSNGTTIYLDMPIKALANRLIIGKSKRPLIRSVEEEELEQVLSDKLKTRLEFYQKATINFEPLKEKLQDLVQKISTLKQVR